MKQELEFPPVVTESTTTDLTEPSLFGCHRELGLNHDPPTQSCVHWLSLSLKLHSLNSVGVWLAAADLLCSSFGLILGARVRLTEMKLLHDNNESVVLIEFYFEGG